MNWNQINFDNIYQNSNEAIRWIQQQLGIKVDGLIGPQTIKALQNKIGTIADGIWGKNSAIAAKNFISSQSVNDIENIPTNSPTIGQRVKSFFTDRKKGESVNSENNTTNIENVPTMSIGEYIYRSGSVGTRRRLGNIISVGRNLISGMINPNGNNATLSEGGRRQMVGASLNHYDRTGKYGIDDVDHQQLGGISEQSGAEFRKDSNENQGSVGISGYIQQAANAPYHNIYGQSGYTSDNGETFSPTIDAYTFNNVWEGDKVTNVMNDGEGIMSLQDSIKAGHDAYKSGSGIKAAIETAASQRGVNVIPGKSSIVTPKNMAKYQQEYNAYVALSPEEKMKINQKFRYNG